MTLDYRTIHRKATAVATVMRLAQADRPFCGIAIAACRALAVAGVVVVVLGLCLTQHQILDAVVGSNAVDVMHYFSWGERASDVRFHHKAMHQERFPVAPDDDISSRINRSLAATPGRGSVSEHLALLGELTRPRARGGVSRELALPPCYGRAAHCAWFGDLGHASILARLQEV